jgi:hypothetical protein
MIIMDHEYYLDYLLILTAWELLGMCMVFDRLGPFLQASLWCSFAY